MPNQLPKKVFLSIGDIARWLDLETHVVRFWSDEFSQQLGRIQRRSSGHRYYTRAQAITFAAIKELLQVELYTHAGARRQLDRVSQELKVG